MPGSLRDLFDEQLALYKRQRSITNHNRIPDTDAIPIENPQYWLKIPEVVCVFVDMKGSTKLSATEHDKSTAGVYQLFTGTAVRLFHELEAPYIDVRGDGVFALFNQDQVYRAFAAAVSFKTFAKDVFAQAVLERTALEVGAHIGIDQKTLLVRKIGLKRHGGRSDRQNEVWAGKPVNMASKLAAMGNVDQLIVSERYHARLKDERTLMTCGCGPGGALPGPGKKPLWREEDVREDLNFDFNKAYVLGSTWCRNHGQEYFEAILALDNE